MQALYIRNLLKRQDGLGLGGFSFQLRQRESWLWGTVVVITLNQCSWLPAGIHID
jgi:hypothetical protein